MDPFNTNLLTILRFGASKDMKISMRGRSALGAFELHKIGQGQMLRCFHDKLFSLSRELVHFSWAGKGSNSVGERNLRVMGANYEEVFQDFHSNAMAT